MINNEIRWISKSEESNPEGLQIQVLANTYNGFRSIVIRDVVTETDVNHKYDRQVFVNNKVELQALTTELLKILKEVEDEKKVRRE